MRPLPRKKRAIRDVSAHYEYELVSELDYASRDVGLQLLGAPGGAPLAPEYAVGVFRGPLHGGVGSRDTYPYVARISASPLGRTRVGAGWSSRHFTREAPDEFELKRENAWEIDLEYGSFDPGIHLLGKLAFGDFDPFAGTGFFGVDAWLGYRTPPLGTRSAVEQIMALRQVRRVPVG